MKTFLLILILNSLLHANDMSSIDIHAGSGDEFTKVHFIISDSLGRRTGFKSFYYGDHGYIGVNAFTEIPYSNYYTESIGSLDPSVVPNEPESAIFWMQPVVKDTYTISFIGLGNVKYFMEIHLVNTLGGMRSILSENYISSGTTQQYSIYLDPTPGAPAPVITKIVTFDTLRQDLLVAQKLNQIGDEKFVNSLIRNIDLAEKLAKVCEKRKFKDKSCHPAIAVLKLFIKRLEIANKLCDNNKECKSKCSKIADCDEEVEWAEFRKEHGKDKDFKDFFEEWDKDEWHKHKKGCKRFVSDEALKIITEDTQWLIKSLGGEVKEKDKK